MKKRTIIAAVALLMCVGGAMADNGQVVTIDGKTVNKNATRLTFDSDNVTVTFVDGSSMTADMEAVEISFDWDITTGIDNLTFDGQSDDASQIGNAERTNNTVFDLQGRKVSGNNQRGLFIVRQGNKNVIKIAH